ncbi:MAG: hypothetical protein WBZ36_16745 [Candidatus Nitrosopolaris sp.]
MIDENLTPIEIHDILLESILSPVVFLLSILVSIIDLPIAYYIWIVLIPTKVIVRKFIDRAVQLRSSIMVRKHLEENKDFIRVEYLPKGSSDYNAVE